MKFILFMFLGSMVMDFAFKAAFPQTDNSDPKAVLEMATFDDGSKHASHFSGGQGSDQDEDFSYISSEPQSGVRIKD
jgi:hypothetical protein